PARTGTPRPGGRRGEHARRRQPRRARRPQPERRAGRLPPGRLLGSALPGAVPERLAAARGGEAASPARLGAGAGRLRRLAVVLTPRSAPEHPRGGDRPPLPGPGGLGVLAAGARPLAPRRAPPAGGHPG